MVNANMEGAIRVISVERGHDPREFALVSFGGAGGMHAADLARRLSILTVLVPANPGILSALACSLLTMSRSTPDRADASHSLYPRARRCSVWRTGGARATGHAREGVAPRMCRLAASWI